MGHRPPEVGIREALLGKTVMLNTKHFFYYEICPKRKQQVKQREKQKKTVSAVSLQHIFSCYLKLLGTVIEIVLPPPSLF